MSDATHTSPLRRRCDLLLIAVFLVSITLPLVGMWIPGPWQTRHVSGEQRSPAPWPAPPRGLAAIGAYPEHLEAWIDDHFAFRAPLIHAYQRWVYFGLGDSPSIKVRRGHGDWLFFDGDPDTTDASPFRDALGLEPLTAAQLEVRRWCFQDQHEYLRDQGMAYHLVLLPSKPAVYPEHLPAYARNRPAPGWRRQLVEYLQQHTDVPVLDVTEAIRAAKSAGRVWDPTDTHWNDPGTAAAYRAIIETLSGSLPVGPPLPPSAFEQIAPREPGGDLARMVGLDDELAINRLRLQPRTPRAAVHTTGGEGDSAPIRAVVDNPALPTAVAYRDSFTEILTPFLSEHFRRIDYVWGRYGSAMPDIETLAPDQVLQIMADRVLSRPLIYAPRMQEHCARKRFTASTDTGGVWSAASGIDGLTAESNTLWGVANKQLILESPEVQPVRLRLPALDRRATALPILRIDLRNTRRAECKIVTETDQIVARRILEPGRNRVHLPLLDPSLEEPLFLLLSPSPVPYGFNSLEVRYHPRDRSDSASTIP